MTNKPYSNVLVALLKGIVYSTDKYWSDIAPSEIDIKKYFAEIHLDVIIDKSEGYAYLKQKSSGDNDEDTHENNNENSDQNGNTNENSKEDATLKLIEKRPLNFHVSLLCLLLRRFLIENDSEGESVKAILTKESILNMVKPFYKETTNEEKPIKQIDAAIKRVIEEGFLRRMKNDEEQYEINRIIKAFVNADMVKNSLQKLKDYANPTQ